MATPFTETISGVVTQFQTAFEQTVIIRRDEHFQRAILEMRGNYGAYRIQLREVWRVDGSRKYAYYVLHQSKIIAGFDNASDTRALQLKYGPDFSDHRFELIPHRHTADKQTVELTNEMDCSSFISWLKQSLPSSLQ